MLYFPYSLLVGTLLFLLVSSVALNQSGATMTPCIWIKNPDIKECILSIMSPEILCYNIETSTILSIGCLVPEMYSAAGSTYGFSLTYIIIELPTVELYIILDGGYF